MQKTTRLFYKLGPTPAFGRLGLGGSSGGYTFHGNTFHASLCAFGAQLEGDRLCFRRLTKHFCDDLFDFGCQRCGEKLNVKEVSSITTTAEEDLRKCGVGDVVENLERFLHIYSLRLHPRHQLMFTASLRLGWVYGR